MTNFNLFINSNNETTIWCTSEADYFAAPKHMHLDIWENSSSLVMCSIFNNYYDKGLYQLLLLADDACDRPTKLGFHQGHYNWSRNYHWYVRTMHRNGTLEGRLLSSAAENPIKEFAIEKFPSTNDSWKLCVDPQCWIISLI